MIQPTELENIQFSTKVVGGYNPDEVDEYVDFAVQKYTEAYHACIELKKMCSVLQSKVSVQGTSSSDDELADARAEAAEIIDSANKRGKSIIEEATKEAERIKAESTEIYNNYLVSAEKLKKLLEKYDLEKFESFNKDLDLAENSAAILGVRTENVIASYDDVDKIESSQLKENLRSDIQKQDAVKISDTRVFPKKSATVGSDEAAKNTDIKKNEETVSSNDKIRNDIDGLLGMIDSLDRYLVDEDSKNAEQDDAKDDTIVVKTNNAEVSDTDKKENTEEDDDAFYNMLITGGDNE